MHRRQSSPDSIEIFLHMLHSPPASLLTSRTLQMEGVRWGCGERVLRGGG